MQSPRIECARPLIALLFAMAGVAACGEVSPSNALSGSIGSIGYSLQFDSLRVTRSPQQLVIRYVSDTILESHQQVTNQPVRLVVDLARVETPIAEQLALPQEVTLQHAAVRLDEDYQIIDEPEFPEVESGSLDLDASGGPTDPAVRGSFSCLFVNGYTLNGVFGGELSPSP